MIEWTKAANKMPPPHRKYYVQRGGFIHTATPCYGMHNPWWVQAMITFHTASDPRAQEAPPIDILPTDEWAPVPRS